MKITASSIKGSPLAAWLKKHHQRFKSGTISTTPLEAAHTIMPRLAQKGSPNKSARGAGITLVVIHDTEGSYAAAVSWLCNPAAQASAHVVLSEDGSHATQLVPWSEKAWSCVNFNPQSLNLEMAGKASVGYAKSEIAAAAAIAAYWCHLYRIPIRNALGGKQSGITFHQDLGVAGGGHHDPGWSDSQKAAFISEVRVAAAKSFSPTVWGRK